MSTQQNLDMVHRMYDTGMAPDVVAEIVADEFVFDITPGFPEGGIYHGWPDVAENFFGRLNPRYTSFGPVAEDFHACDDMVFVQGHYHAVSHTGDEGDIRFVHAWTVANGKLVRLRQSADSHVAQQLAK